MTRGLGWALVAALGMASGSTPALADQFHYRNIIMGDRAIGLGGAYTAVADDASGVYYNPAGLAFALSNDISGSVNAFYSREATYKEALGDIDFVEESTGSVAPFFGGLQKLDNLAEGLVFAFGIYSTDDDLKDQDDLFEQINISGLEIPRYHRTSNARASTTFYSGALGYRVMPNLSLGLGLSVYQVDELIQEYQDTIQQTGLNSAFYRIRSSNLRQHLVATGLQATLGAQLSFAKNFAIGATMKFGAILSQTFEIASETRSTTLQDSSDPAQATAFGRPSQTLINTEYDDALGTPPPSIALGFAWFASAKALVTTDLMYHLGSDDAGEVKEFGNVIGDAAKTYERVPVFNWAAGVEYYFVPTFPVRFGIFSNNDARDTVDKKDPYTVSTTTTASNGTSVVDKTITDYEVSCNLETVDFDGDTATTNDTVFATPIAEHRDYIRTYCGQPDKIDYIGTSLFLAWVQPNSQIAAGVVYQFGSGQAQKTGDHRVQDVDAWSRTFAFSATHSF